MTEQERILLIEEASRRAESKRPKTYIRVPEKKEDPLLIEAQGVADELSSLIQEEVRETFRIEINSNPLVNDPYVVRKSIKPHTLILPRHIAEVNLRGIIITGIVNHYLNSNILLKGQIDSLLNILTGKESNTELIPVAKKNKKSKRDRVPKPKKEKAPTTKSDIEITPGAKMVKLSTICEELSLDPKKARIKLRKHFNKPESGWEWSEDKVNDIKDFLSK